MAETREREVVDGAAAALPLRALLVAAARCLAAAFPAACVLVLRHEGAETHAKVIAGHQLPQAWNHRLLALEQLPLVRTALAQPQEPIERYVRLAAADDKGAGVGKKPKTAPMQALCAGFVATSSTRFALLCMGSAEPAQKMPRSAAFGQARLMVNSLRSAGGARRIEALTAIHRAKLEWELSVDALPEIVGMLDRNMRVVRISRALERWRLGSVHDAIGKYLHAVLHPGCDEPGCALRASLGAAVDRVRAGEYAEFEISDRALMRDLIVKVGAPVSRRPETVSAAALRAVFSVIDVTSLRAAEREMRRLNQTLEERVTERTERLSCANRSLKEEVERRAAAERSLRRSMREVEAVSEQLMNAQESERKRIAQDLHDSVGQTLSVIKYSLERGQELLRRQEPEEAAAALDGVVARVQLLMEEVRTISMNLRPALLDDLGAASAVRGLCREWQDVYRDIEVHYQIGVDDADIPPVLATPVFRSVQELLNNVVRHAGAQQVVVYLGLVAGVLSVRVQDDGIGFELGAGPGAGLKAGDASGLRGLKERCEKTGGQFELTSAPGKGTMVQLEWPIAAGHAAPLTSTSLN